MGRERTCRKAADHAGKAGLAHWDSKDSKSLAIKTVGVAKVGETPSLIGEFVEKWDRAEQASCIVSSLTPPPETAPQHIREGCPALSNA